MQGEAEQDTLGGSSPSPETGPEASGATTQGDTEEAEDEQVPLPYSQL